MKTITNTFPPIDKSTWKARLEKDLKGVNFEALIHTDANELQIAPFYTKEDVTSNNISYKENPDWDIISLIIVEDEKDANTAALQLLGDGVNGIHFKLSKKVDFEVLFNDIHLPSIFIKLEWNELTIDQIDALKDYTNKKNFDWSTLPLHIVHNPLLAALQNGQKFNAANWQTINNQLKEQSNISIDGIVLRNAGANTTNTLAIMASQLNEYIEIVDEINGKKSITKLYIDYAVSTKLFEEIASIRALKILIDTILTAHDMQDVKVHLHIATSSIYKANLDVHSNLLRDTIAAMAGVLGGCTSLCVTAFDNNSSSSFSNRMAKNIQLILKEEAYFNIVSDISAGSYYIEHRTNDIATKAWEIFNIIEMNGGFQNESESILNSVQKDATTLIARYKEGTEVLIGVNKYPNPSDEAFINESKNQKNILDALDITSAIKSA